jgi:hypothetical protein
LEGHGRAWSSNRSVLPCHKIKLPPPSLPIKFTHALLTALRSRVWVGGVYL